MPVARPESSGARVIAHVDMDCFYVQVEQRKQPHLRGQPTAVVQYNSWKGGGLIAVGYEARKDGVKRSMRGDEAKKACPQIQLVQVPVARGKADLSTYRNAGSEVVSILARKGRCERASIDEVYLDLTDAAEAMLAEAPPESFERIDEEALKSHVLGLNEDGSNRKETVREWLQRSEADHRDKLLACGAFIVADLRMQVLKETEFTCSAGIAHNKMLAKLASGMNKPAQQTVVPFASVEGLLEHLPVKKMKQLGGKLGSSLQIDLGVNTVGELLQFSEDKLQERYGVNTGTWLWNIARGISGEEVEGRLLPKSHGSGKTFPGPQALKTIASVEHWLNELCEELSERLQSDLDVNKRIAHTLTLHATAFKSSDSESHRNFPSKSCPLRYGPTKIKEDTLNLFQAGLREYIGSSGISTHGSRYRGWGITSLSVSASKIVAVPAGTCSIMRYFHGQDQSCCSSEQVKDRFPEAAPSSPSGTESYSGSHPTEPPIKFHKEEARIGGAIPIVDENEIYTEVCMREDTCAALQPVDGQDPSCSSQGAHHEFIQETSALSSSVRVVVLSRTQCCTELNQNELHMESQAEETGTKYLRCGMRPREQKRKLVKDKGSSSILRLFQNFNNSSSQKREHATNTDEPQASSSLDFQSTGTFSELNEAEVPKENPLGMPTLGQQDELRRDAWDYKIDEIDPTVFNELPPQIQQELRAWLRPQKRANLLKRGSTIAHYFLPTKNT
ncbi:DNA polymerase eta isoform X1 [Rhododendron vialii]|uniref:DNA polymerase eta isoform X1 n=1 Tax=Rhododendron vialii TaxID=182163 RepID=UPI00265DF89C|nr:DNA polymerase eta isoform X1 [Rhododendron vialii]